VQKSEVPVVDAIVCITNETCAQNKRVIRPAFACGPLKIVNHLLTNDAKTKAKRHAHNHGHGDVSEFVLHGEL